MRPLSNRAVPPLRCSKCGGVGRIEHKVWKMGKGYVAEGRICTTCGGSGLLKSK